jgi:hypothetical protein
MPILRTSKNTVSRRAVAAAVGRNEHFWRESRVAYLMVRRSTFALRYTFEHGTLEAKGRRDPCVCADCPSDALMAQNAREEFEEPIASTEGDIADQGEWTTRPNGTMRPTRKLTVTPSMDPRPDEICLTRVEKRTQRILPHNYKNLDFLSGKCQSPLGNPSTLRILN